MAGLNYDDLFEDAGRRYNVDPSLIKTVYHVESSGGINVGRSIPDDPDSPLGPFQMRPSTARSVGVTDPSKFEQAVYGAAAYLRQGLNAPSSPLGDTGTPHNALAFYHAGPDQSGYGPKTAAYIGKAAKIYPTFGRSSPAANNASAVDPDVEAGKQYMERGVVPPATPQSTSNQSDPDVEAGKAMLQQLQTEPQPAPKAAPSMGDAEKGVDDYGRSFSAPPAPLNGVERVVKASAGGVYDAFNRGPLGLSADQSNALSALGITPPAEGGGTVMQRLNSGAINAIAPVVDTVGRGINALVSGYQRGISQAGQEVGQPGLGRDLAALPEAFPTGNMLGGAGLGPSTGGSLAANRLLQSVDNRMSASTTAAPVPQVTPRGLRLVEPGEILPPTARVVSDANGAQYVPVTQEVPTARSSASDSTAAAASDGKQTPTPNPSPNSVGAAATTPGEGAPPTPAEALAQRTQGERNRVIAPAPMNTIDNNVYVPGVRPTLPEVTGKPSDALEFQIARDHPTTKDQIERQLAENHEHRLEHYDVQSGSAPQLERMTTERSANADRDLAPMQNDPQPVALESAAPLIEKMLSDPRIIPRDSVVKAIQDVRSKLVDGEGAAITNPNQLYGVGEHINDLLNRPAVQADTGRVAKSQLTQIKNALYDDIEKTNPSFADYRKNFQDASGPIDAMRMLQENRASITSADGKSIMPGKFNGFMKNLVEDRASGDALSPASKLTDDQMNALMDLHADLKRNGNLNLHRLAGGSPTSMLDSAKAAMGDMATRGAGAALGGAVGGPGGAMVGGSIASGAKNLIGNALTGRANANRLADMLSPGRIYPPQTLH